MSVGTHFLRWSLGLARAETQTTESERQALVRWADGKHTLVEIGVWHGVTTTMLRAAMAETGTIYAIDPYFPGRTGVNFQRLIALAEVKRVPRGTVRWIRSLGAEALRSAQAQGLQKVEVIFIDGDHSYEGLRQDWEYWSPLVAPGGVVALHDSRHSPAGGSAEAGSARFTREVILRDARFEMVQEIDSLTVLMRQGNCR